jgi:hypothetical protein
MAAPRATSKGTVLEVVMLALGHSRLREMGLDAMRAVLKSDPRLAVLDGAFSLQPVWDLLESQDGFDVEAAKPPFCFIKSLEGRLGVGVSLPAALAGLSAKDSARLAALCPARREDVERILANPLYDEVASSGLLSPQERDREKEKEREKEESTAWAPGKRKRRRVPRAAVGTVAGLVVLAAAAFLTVYLINNRDHTPKFTRIDPAEFAGDIPLGSAEMWAAEVHARLSDPTWLTRPEPARRAALIAALERLSARHLDTLIIEDDAKQMKASAQYVGKPPIPSIRFY